MKQIQIIDTFPAFERIWAQYQTEPITVQILAWYSFYQAEYPQLLNLVIEDYASQNEDWHTIAIERIFPSISRQFFLMRAARQNLIVELPVLWHRAQTEYDLESELTGVIYVGLGCGAGWVTQYNQQPAILFGLESIAECGWSSRRSIRGLCAHEMGHIAHATWRNQTNAPDYDGP